MERVKLNLTPAMPTKVSLVPPTVTNSTESTPSTRVPLNLSSKTTGKDIRILKPDTLITWWADEDKNGVHYNQRYGRLLRYDTKPRLTAVVEIPRHGGNVIVFVPAENIEPVR